MSQSINILQKIQPNKNKEIIDRLNTAINFAKNSNVILVQNIKITIDSNKKLRITGFSKASDLGSITKQSAINELYMLKQVYNNWLLMTDKFEEFENWKNPTFVLGHLAHKNGIGICEMNGSKIDWLIKI